MSRCPRVHRCRAAVLAVLTVLAASVAGCSSGDGGAGGEPSNAPTVDRALETDPVDGGALAPLTADGSDRTVADLPDTSWESIGFGYVLGFDDGDGFELTQVTRPHGALRLVVGSVEPGADGVARLVSDSDTELLSDGEALGVIRADGGRLLLRRPGTLDDIVFEPLAARPDVLDVTPADDPVAVVDFACTALARHHAFLQDRIDEIGIPSGALDAGTTWSDVCDEARRWLTVDSSRSEVCRAIWGMLEPLGDAHVSFYDPRHDDNCDFSGWQPSTFATTSPGMAASDAAYDIAHELVHQAFDLVDGTYLDSRIGVVEAADGELEYGVIAEARLLYLRLYSFSDFSDSGESAEDLAVLRTALDDMAALYVEEGLEGIVIDLRYNEGGSDDLGIELASRFNSEPYLAYSEAVYDERLDPCCLGEPQDMIVPATNAPGFRDAPVALLTGRLSISAAETFTMAMMERTAGEPPVLRIGEPTQGVFADVHLWSMPNGMILEFPNERYLDSDGAHYEMHGIPPDIEVPVFSPEQIAAGVDPVLDRAIVELG